MFRVPLDGLPLAEVCHTFTKITLVIKEKQLVAYQDSSQLCSVVLVGLLPRMRSLQQSLRGSLNGTSMSFSHVDYLLDREAAL